MGDIIRFPGSWQGPEDENEPIPQSGETEKEEEEIILDADKVERLVDILKNLRGRTRNRETAATYATIVESYPPQEIIDRINHHNELDVARRPAFFKALLGEVNRRREEFGIPPRKEV